MRKTPMSHREAIRPALETIDTGLAGLVERAPDAEHLSGLAAATVLVLAQTPARSERARRALHDGRLALARLAGLLWDTDEDVRRVITPVELAQLLRNRLVADFAVDEDLGAGARAALREAAEQRPPVGLLRLDPRDCSRAVRRGPDLVLENFEAADKDERARVMKALDFSSAWQRDERGPGRPTGTTGAYKYPSRESFVAAIREKVYPLPKRTGRLLDSFSEKEIAQRLRLSPRTMQQRMDEYGITWDDIYKQRL
jgi:hypothetical protein